MYILVGYRDELYEKLQYNHPGINTLEYLVRDKTWWLLMDIDVKIVKN